MKAVESQDSGSAGQHQGAVMKKEWQTKTLGDICEMYQPKTISGKDMVEDGPYPVYGANGVIGRYNQFNHEEPQLLITCRGATCGSVNISAPRSWVTGNAMVVRPKNESLEMRYLEYLFRGGIDISKAITGAAQPQITRTNLEPLVISFPESPTEQQRIVGLLDEAFEGLATAKATAQKNLQNARALFESHLQSVFTQRGPGWVENKLDDVTDLITCGVAKRPDYVPEGIPFLSAKNVKSGQVIWSGHQYISVESHQALTKHNKPKIGDILYTRVGSFGEAAIIDRDVEFSIFVSLTLIKPKPVVLNSFLKHYLNSSAVKELAADSITGSGVGNLNVGTVREFPIHLPQLAEQRYIVSQLDDLREETQRLARIYERKLAALEALKKSLLHQAFTGEL